MRHAWSPGRKTSTTHETDRDFRRVLALGHCQVE
jgi:hypothetical protein